jgi:hypothetical protein
MEHVLYLRVSTPRTASDGGEQRLVIVRPDLAGTPNYLRAADGTPLDLAHVAQGDGGETEVAGIFAGLQELQAGLREVGYYGPGLGGLGLAPAGTPGARADLARALVALWALGGNPGDYWAFQDQAHPARWWGYWGLFAVTTPEEHARYHPDASLVR